MRTNPITAAFCKVFFVVIILMVSTVYGQRHELGVQSGITNLVGDVGRTSFIFQKPFGDISEFGVPLYVGIIYKRNLNPYQGLRLNLGMSNIQFSDAYAKQADRRVRRGDQGMYIYGSNTMYNADIQYEYNFLPINNEQKSMVSPYIFGGLGAISFYNQRAVINVDEIYISKTPYEIKLYNDLKASIPFGIGLKYKYRYNWVLSGEVKFRYTLTDNMDYSNIEAKNIKIVNSENKVIKESNLTEDQKLYRSNFINSRQIGNPNSKDWINAVTIGLSYSFGRPPCYCD